MPKLLCLLLAMLPLAGKPALGAPASAESIAIGVSAPLSGAQASEGRAIVQAATWAVEAINAAGGIGGRLLALVVEDDGCDDERAVAAASRLALLSLGLVTGHPCSAAALAAARVYGAAGLLFIAAAPRHPDLTRRRAGPAIFRLAGRDDLQGAATASYLTAAYGGRRLAIVHDRTRYARALVEGVRKSLASAFPDPLPEFGIVAGSKDYAATVAGLKTHRADVVYFAGFPSEAVALWGQLRGTGHAPDLLGSDALANAESEMRAISAGDRPAVRVIRPYAATDAQSAAPLMDRLAATSLPAAASAIAVHAAIEAWAAAAKDAGSTEPLLIARRLAGEPVDTVIGKLSFDAAGDARLPSFATASVAAGRLVAEPINFTAESVVQGGQAAQEPSNGQRSRAIPGPASLTAAASGIREAAGPPPLPVRHPMRARRRLP